jgi:hypothetical protein
VHAEVSVGGHTHTLGVPQGVGQQPTTHRPPRAQSWWQQPGRARWETRAPQRGEGRGRNPCTAQTHPQTAHPASDQCPTPTTPQPFPSVLRTTPTLPRAYFEPDGNARLCHRASKGGIVRPPLAQVGIPRLQRCQLQRRKAQHQVLHLLPPSKDARVRVGGSHMSPHALACPLDPSDLLAYDTAAILLARGQAHHGRQCALSVVMQRLALRPPRQPASAPTRTHTQTNTQHRERDRLGETACFRLHINTRMGCV